jgi:hypothetical protein
LTSDGEQVFGDRQTAPPSQSNSHESADFGSQVHADAVIGAPV